VFTDIIVSIIVEVTGFDGILVPVTIDIIWIDNLIVIGIIVSEIDFSNGVDFSTFFTVITNWD
jgi:hypothetical protein